MPAPAEARSAVAPLRKLIRYGIVGVMGAITHMSTLFALVELGLARPIPATVAGFVLALLTSYLLNRYWTFQHQGAHLPSMAKYCVVSVFGLLLNMGIITLCTDVLGWWYGWGGAIAVVVVAANNFFLNNFWTFAPARPS